MALKNFQLTENKLILQSEPKIKDGKQKVPTNVAKPLDSESDKKLNLEKQDWTSLDHFKQEYTSLGVFKQKWKQQVIINHMVAQN